MLRHLRSLLKSQRHVAALVAAVALSQAVGAPNAFACALGVDGGIEHAQMAMSQDIATEETPDSLPPESGCDTVPRPSCPPSPDGGCALMSGCATIGVALAERSVPAFSVTPRALVPLILQHELQRATAPEPPPPRA